MRSVHIKNEGSISFPRFLYFFVHASGIVLADIVSHLQDFHRNGAVAHGNFDFVAHLHIIAGLYHTAVDADASIVAGLVGYGAPLDQAGAVTLFLFFSKYIFFSLQISS